MNKNKILSVSFVGTLLFFIAVYISIFGLCKIDSDFLCSRPHEDMYSALLFLFFPLFLFSLITYKMKEAVYLTWYNFVKWWIPLSLLAIIISPRYSHDWMFPIDKGRVAFSTTVIFALVSLILIGYKSYKLRGK